MTVDQERLGKQVDMERQMVQHRVVRRLAPLVCRWEKRLSDFKRRALQQPASKSQ